MRFVFPTAPFFFFIPGLFLHFVYYFYKCMEMIEWLGISEKDGVEGRGLCFSQVNPSDLLLSCGPTSQQQSQSNLQPPGFKLCSKSLLSEARLRNRRAMASFHSRDHTHSLDLHMLTQCLRKRSVIMS